MLARPEAPLFPSNMNTHIVRLCFFAVDLFFANPDSRDQVHGDINAEMSSSNISNCFYVPLGF